MVINPIVSARWANPRAVAGKYQIDAEFKCDADPFRKIAAMNLRFFYSSEDFEHDAATMRFVDMLPDWRLGAYQTLRGAKGNTGSAALFNFSAPAVYVNTAIEGPWFTENAANVPALDGWARYFTLELTPKRPIGQGDFAPPLIWDLEDDETRGSFLPGSDGLVLALVIPNTMTRQASTFRACQEDAPSQFNWVYNGSLSLPYGSPLPNNYV